MDEETRFIKEQLKKILFILANLEYQLLPQKKDYSKQSAIAQELVVKGKPPRKQPKKDNTDELITYCIERIDEDIDVEEIPNIYAQLCLEEGGFLEWANELNS